VRRADPLLGRRNDFVELLHDSADAVLQAGAMTVPSLFPPTADRVIDAVRAASACDLDAPTPCDEFDLRTLVNHFIGTTSALGAIGRREALDSADPYGSRLDHTDGNWQLTLEGSIRALADAWARPEAWQGKVSMGGPQPMPAVTIGEMALAELALHGWDFARATGQTLEVDDSTATELLRGVTETAALGRSMGAYGDEVPVSPQSSKFTKALAMSGRDPVWPR
jgi:uncharacterized protein (TIGR03086 family)